MISERASNLYLSASTMPVAQREAFLSRECGDDQALINEVLSLLDAGGEADRYFDGLSGRISLTALAGDDDETLPTEAVGPWRALRLLGRGGMGAVYLAERTDDQYQQQVALKLLPLGANTDTMRARFLSERQILARLTHPNIARLLDGGITRDGSPWFVMDYVKGVPIDEYCEAHELDLEARLALLLQVMRAVQYAHGNLVVHRDLKPANVLVDDQGQVHLLDFGIAKVLDPQSDENAHTGMALRPVTPAYASPEMLRGETVDVTTDVYSIGVLMYQLLTGQLPLKYDAMTLPKMYAHAANTAPPPLTRLRPDLDSDLQAIALKALAKTPEGRYVSVEAMATDLSRYCEGLPIAAQPPSYWRRFHLFAGRHRLGLSFALFAALSLLTVSGISIRAALTAERQARTIEIERDTVEQTRAFLQSIFELSGPNESKGLTITARELLDSGARRIRTQLDSQPEVRAELLATLAQIYMELSALPEASALYDEAAAVYRSLARDGAHGLANTLYKRALIAERQSDYERARQLALEAEQAFDRVDDAANLARAVVTTGRILQRQGQLDEAQSRFDKALAMHTTLHGPVHVDVARDLMALGTVQMHRGNYADAHKLYTRAGDIRLELFGRDDTGRIELAHQLSQVLIFQNKHEEALGILNEGLELSRRLLPEGNSGLFYLFNGLADVHRRMGQLDLAEQRFTDALHVLNRFFDEQHQEHAMVRAQLGRLALTRGDAASAEPLLRESIERIEIGNPGFPFLPDMKVTFGQCLLQLGLTDEARTVTEESWTTLAHQLGEAHPRAQSALRSLIKVHETSSNSIDADLLRARVVTNDDDQSH